MTMYNANIIFNVDSLVPSFLVTLNFSEISILCSLYLLKFSQSHKLFAIVSKDILVS